MRISTLLCASTTVLITGQVIGGEPVEFLVSEMSETPVHGDSFTITLVDPSLIAHARSLVELGPLAIDTIVWARVAPGGDAINRDPLAPGSPPWNWRVLEVEGFFGLTAEIFDGWPTFIGEDPVAWMANTAPDQDGLGYIGLWSYTVTAELGAPPTACIPDLADPRGALDFSDITAFLIAFDGRQPPADLAAPFGAWDFSDVVAFLSAFGAGCP